MRKLFNFFPTFIKGSCFVYCAKHPVVRTRSTQKYARATSLESVLKVRRVVGLLVIVSYSVGRRRLFPFRKQAMPFLTVDAIIGNQACQN